LIGAKPVRGTGKAGRLSSKDDTQHIPLPEQEFPPSMGGGGEFIVVQIRRTWLTKPNEWASLFSTM